MNAVGIDVSKGKSTIAIMQPLGVVVASPFEVSHNGQELKELVERLKLLPGETKVVMEYTGTYYEPIAQFLHNEGIFVSVVNAMLLHNYSGNSIRKAKTDKKDAVRIAQYAIDRWLDLQEYIPEDEIRRSLKLLNRQYTTICKVKTMLNNNFISLVDQSFPGVNKLFTSPQRASDGHLKWVDFIIKFPHCECVSKIPRSAFKDKYCRWCNKNAYYYSDKKADTIYDYSKTLVPTLPNSDYIAALTEQSAKQFNCACETLSEIQKQMNALSERLPEHNVVMEMFGVGKVLAPQLIAEIGDTRRFHSRKAITAFAGLDAPPYQSGNIDIKSRSISKRGSPHLRRTLFQVVDVILKNSPADEPVYQFLDKKRAEGKPYKVYMMAAANKFLRIYYAKVNEVLNA